MCCFTQPVEVAATRIFARATARGRQVLAYEMQFSTPEPVAMVLPIPTPTGSAETTVRFISLERYPTMFDALFRAFHPPEPMDYSSKRSLVVPKLAVHHVGAFVASFVPRLADFTRLDPRFRMPAGTLDQVPGYADWGFAVFQLSPTRGVGRVHPMAFEFETREPTRLFFPTMHVHDGSVHATAEFDHCLYAQGVDRLRTFETSSEVANKIVEASKSEGVIDPDQRLSRREIIGIRANGDVWFTLLDAL
jgi:hypothetical protein